MGFYFHSSQVDDGLGAPTMPLGAALYGNTNGSTTALEFGERRIPFVFHSSRRWSTMTLGGDGATIACDDDTSEVRSFCLEYSGLVA